MGLNAGRMLSKGPRKLLVKRDRNGETYFFTPTGQPHN